MKLADTFDYDDTGSRYDPEIAMPTTRDFRVVRGLLVGSLLGALLWLAAAAVYFEFLSA
jgi:hypothetical protein